MYPEISFEVHALVASRRPTEQRISPVMPVGILGLFACPSSNSCNEYSACNSRCE